MQTLIKHRTTGALLFTALTTALGTASLNAQDVIVEAKKVVIAFGAGSAEATVLTDSALLIRDGKIALVGSDIPAETRASARVIDYGSATISPGFVLAATTLGRDADLGEGAFAFTPDLRTSEAFDPWQKELAQLGPAGVTAFGLAPSPRNVAGGIGALIKPAKKQARIETPEAFVGFSLIRNARSQERLPTSLMGALQMLRESFEAAQVGVEVGPDLAVLRQVMSGQRRAMIHANTFAELNGALDLAASFNFAPVIIGASDADKLMAKLAERATGIVLAPLNPKARIADLELPRKLAKAGVPFCFAGRPDQLRLSAALAVHHGLDRDMAGAALTRIPASLVGAQETVGSLRQGRGADFVVFEGDLLDLSSRHVATWVDGEMVHGTKPTRSKPTGTKRSQTMNTAGGR